jgi:exonuclease V gamma subunit
LALLSQWHTCWHEAWQRPLPAARKTACAWLQAARNKGNEDDANAGYDAAVEQWDGGYVVTGEYSTSPYLQLSFHVYDEVAEHLPHWADLL